MADEVALQLRLLADASVARLIGAAARVEAALLGRVVVRGVSVLRFSIAALLVAGALYALHLVLRTLLGLLLPPASCAVRVELTAEEAKVGTGRKWVRAPPGRRSSSHASHAGGAAQDPSTPQPKDFIPCYDPGSLELLGSGVFAVVVPP